MKKLIMLSIVITGCSRVDVNHCLQNKSYYEFVSKNDHAWNSAVNETLLEEEITCVEKL